MKQKPDFASWERWTLNDWADSVYERLMELEREKRAAQSNKNLTEILEEHAERNE